ncbi:hypothetical protein ACFPM7_28815 [Actinokineospora guangxiensis]|uniref:Uncharacterized protein n=1 Tax=Actinokineospora guangxiensis TaxID=1490288 RepID=A0ABW0EWI3_9PSEU
MTAVTTDVRLLSIYLEDHHALLGAVLARAGRLVASDSHLPGGTALREIRDVLTDDREALRALMDTLGSTPSAAKSLLAGVAERLGRLKPNGRLLERSPLSRVVELDALRAAVQDDAALWRVLGAIAETDDRISAADAAARTSRAQRQAQTVERLRVAAAVAALGGREAASAHRR